jgi:hypothetical protein
MVCESIRFMPPNALLPQKKIRALLEDRSGGLIFVVLDCWSSSLLSAALLNIRE